MGIPLADLAGRPFLAAPLGATLGLKLLVVAVLLVCVVWHDVILAERSVRLHAQIQGRGPEPDLVAAAERTRRTASRLGRTNLVLALVVAFFGVQLTMGR